MGVIIFNGVSSADYDIQVENPPGYDTPEKDYEIIHIPGRNGDLAIDDGSYKNVVRQYNIAVGSTRKHYAMLANSISKWINSTSGYVRLEDSYEPDYYRLALYREGRSLSNIRGQAGRTVINFDCKPQRFLKSGDTSVTVVTSGQKLVNPTGFVALPTITVYGSGAAILGIGGYNITISEIDVSLTINSDIQDVYKEAVNKNDTVTLTSGFPVLSSGENEISFTSGITSVVIVPKWWTL